MPQPALWRVCRRVPSVSRMALSMAHPYQIAIRQLGCRATGVRQWGRTGQLFALFQNSFYFNLDEALFCVGHSGLNSGPLNIATDVPKPSTGNSAAFVSAIECGQPEIKVRIGQWLELLVTQSETWQPRTTDCGWSARTLAKGLRAISNFDKGNTKRRAWQLHTFRLAISYTQSPLEIRKTGSYWSQPLVTGPK